MVWSDCDLEISLREQSQGGGSEEYGLCKHDASFKGTKRNLWNVLHLHLHTGISHVERKSWCNLLCVKAVLHMEDSAQQSGSKPAEME